MAPSFEIFNKDNNIDYFKGETTIRYRWDELKKKRIKQTTKTTIGYQITTLGSVFTSIIGLCP